MPRMSMFLARFCAPLCVLFLAGCLSRQQPVQAPTPEPVAVAAVLGVLDSTAVQAVPEPLAERLERVLQAHNLPARPVEPSQYLERFTSKRTTAHRLSELAQLSGDAHLLLLVEAVAEHYSQMNGRYRWTVDVDATIAPKADLAQAFTVSFKVPVFLDHYHEKELQAAEAAGPLIERRLGVLLDAYLGGL